MRKCCDQIKPVRKAQAKLLYQSIRFAEGPPGNIRPQSGRVRDREADRERESELLAVIACNGVSRYQKCLAIVLCWLLSFCQRN